MPITKTSPDSRWAGSVVFPDYLTFPSLFKWETAMNEAKKISLDKDTDNLNTSAFYLKLLPAATSLVTEWHITGLPEKVDETNFPASVKLMSWMIQCVSDLYTETNEVDPKGSAQP